MYCSGNISGLRAAAWRSIKIPGDASTIGGSDTGWNVSRLHIFRPLRRRLPRARLCRIGLACYDRGAEEVCLDVTSFCGGAPIRLQTLPVQKNLPTAQASTRSVFGSFIAIVA